MSAGVIGVSMIISIPARGKKAFSALRAGLPKPQNLLTIDDTYATRFIDATPRKQLRLRGQDFKGTIIRR